MKTLHHRSAGTYVAGTSHLKKGTPCQDRIYAKSLNDATVISLADGAGSCSKSEIGAEIATKYVAEFVCDNIDTIFEKEEQFIAKTIIDGILKRLSKKAEELNVSVKDLSSTLLFVAIKDNQYIAGHIGDGLIGCFDMIDDVQNAKVLSEPENGEYANQTYFITTDNAINHFRIYKNNLDKITGFILMSDGSYECLFDKNSNMLTQANKTMFSWIENKNYTIDKVKDALKENIESEFLKKTHDDCSINLLSLIKYEVEMEEEKIKDTLIIDQKQFADNTRKINQLQEDAKTIKSKLEDLQKKLSEKVDKNDLKQYDSALSKLKDKQSEDTKRIKQLKEDLISVKKELKNINNKPAQKESKDKGFFYKLFKRLFN